MFIEKDLAQFAVQGIEVVDVEKQIENFKRGFPYLGITASATPGKGITRLNERQQEHYIHQYEQWTGSRIKFVPASGAATRMFKTLYEAIQKLDNNETIDWGSKLMQAVKNFFVLLPDFAFYDELKTIVNHIDTTNLKEADYAIILHALLGDNGLNYGSLPKGLLTFHRYADGARTAFEEHLMEAALYGKMADDSAALHFTVSPEHHSKFEELYDNVYKYYEKQYNVRYGISFSEQKKSTDTLAVNVNNEPFRNADGSLLFRPAGHGALLENLNALDADMVFIKNIDNVVPERHVAETVRWKKILAGVLVEKQKMVFAYLNDLENNMLSADKQNEIRLFLRDVFCITFPANLDKNKLNDYLYTKLNRPIRVCGMVKNEGEPGGGPFIARDADGSLSPQIAESQQIDIKNPQQNAILKTSTYFNPVDLLCGIRNYKGEKFDLLQYRDPATGFISLKSKDGKDLKAQELPGLWNGAMSDWNTIFVEVPLITFNPVKTVNDLLRKEHQ
ncbi:MAG: DUF4301 family protein [Prevotellaceae bacterium]|jgi:hypothetical protein|nr:DUF4301 family protein [Prevotellaceae bacterium]